MIELTDEMTSEDFIEWQKGHKSNGHSTPSRDWTAELLQQLQLLGLPEPVTEYHFALPRRWRFDLAYPYLLLAIEIDGGTHGRPVKCHNCGVTVRRILKNGRSVEVREGGRHNTGSGYEKDCEKLNEAAVRGWRVLRFVPKMIESGAAASWIAQIIAPEASQKGAEARKSTAVMDDSAKSSTRRRKAKNGTR